MNTLNHFYESEIATHIKVDAIIRQEKKIIRPEAYDQTGFHTIYYPQHNGKDQADEINTIASQ